MASSTRDGRKVLISYAHENDEHRRRVALFAELLTEAGIDVLIDQIAAGERQDWASWTLARIGEAERVLIIASPEYRRRFEGTGPPDVGRGVQFEGLLIRDEIYRDHRLGLKKFIPVLLDRARREDIPKVLLPYAGTHYRITELSASGVAPVVDLLRMAPGSAPRDAGLPVQRGPEERQPYAALHLRASGGTPETRRDVVQALKNAAGSDDVVDAGRTGVDQTHLTTSPEAVVRVLSKATRAIHALLRGQRSPAAPPLRVALGAHVTEHAADAIDVAEQVACSQPARRMHAVRGGEFVVAVSPAFHALADAAKAHPPAASFRECLDAELDGGSCWVAVPGRLHAPPLPAAPPHDLLPPVETDESSATTRGAPQFVTNAGRDATINNVGHDATITIVQNFGRLR
jgi:hypothetical protein